MKNISKQKKIIAIINLVAFFGMIAVLFIAIKEYQNHGITSREVFLLIAEFILCFVFGYTNKKSEK